ncbi:MAG: glycosyltransferase family 9 protein [Chlamydiales bacterium]
MQFWYKKYLSFYFLLQSARIRRKKRFLLCWNRGLGDLPLGLYGICIHIRKVISDAQICFLTRSDLSKAFELLPQVEVLIDEDWKRGSSIDIDHSLGQLGVKKGNFDVIIEKPDPTRWLVRDIGKMVPKLSWKGKWDVLSHTFCLPSGCIGIHVNTETSSYYGYEKNWPISYWKDLFQSMVRKGKKIILFGLQSNDELGDCGCIDLRGKTTIFEALSIIKNYCSTLIAPDSGLLSLIYFLDSDFPLRVISLWADPNQGILRQRIISPNRYLQHIPLIAPRQNLENIEVSHLNKVLFS